MFTGIHTKCTHTNIPNMLCADALIWTDQTLFLPSCWTFLDAGLLEPAFLTLTPSWSSGRSTVFSSTGSSVAHTKCHIHVLVQQGKFELQSSRLEPHQHSLGCIRLHAPLSTLAMKMPRCTTQRGIWVDVWKFCLFLSCESNRSNHFPTKLLFLLLLLCCNTLTRNTLSRILGLCFGTINRVFFHGLICCTTQNVTHTNTHKMSHIQTTQKILFSTHLCRHASRHTIPHPNLPRASHKYKNLN